MTNARIVLAMTHRERGMNVITSQCRRPVYVCLGVEHGSILLRLDVSDVMTGTTVLTKGYYSTMHTAGPGVRN